MSVFSILCLRNLTNPINLRCNNRIELLSFWYVCILSMVRSLYVRADSPIGDAQSVLILCLSPSLIFSPRFSPPSSSFWQLIFPVFSCSLPPSLMPINQDPDCDPSGADGQMGKLHRKGSGFESLVHVKAKEKEKTLFFLAKQLWVPAGAAPPRWLQLLNCSEYVSVFTISTHGGRAGAVSQREEEP